MRTAATRLGDTQSRRGTAARPRSRHLCLCGDRWQRSPAELLDLAIEGRVVLVVSPLLMAELGEVLQRDRFRRYITTEEVHRFIEAIGLLAEHADDPPTSGWTPICRDPDDDYLVALADGTSATFLVSGDRDLIELDRPGLDVRSPRDAVDAVMHRHPWEMRSSQVMTQWPSAKPEPKGTTLF